MTTIPEPPDGTARICDAETVAAVHANGERIIRDEQGDWWLEKPDGPPHTMLSEWGAGRLAASLGFDADEDFSDAELFHAGRANDRSKTR